MKYITNISALVFLLVGIAASCKRIDKAPVLPCDRQDTAIHPHAQRYKRIVQDLLEAGVPGTSVTVISPKGTWVYAGGKADLASRIDLTPCHTLRIGSISKVFTAAAVLKLHDEGIIHIKDPVNKYVPRHITDQIVNANEANIEQLLNHSSGIKDYLTGGTIIGILNLSIVKRSAEENLMGIYGQKADFKAGTDLLYSNSNYLLLALVMKYACGKSANDVIKDKVIRPLGLQNTFVSRDMPSTLSRGYYDIYDNGYMKDLTEVDHNAVAGEDMIDGGLIATSYDLALFIEALFTGALLSEQSLQLMQQFSTITQDLGPMNYVKRYGLGLMELHTDHGIAIGHYGSVHCFNGVAVYYPEHKITLAILSNGNSARIGSVLFRKQILNRLFEK